MLMTEQRKPSLTLVCSVLCEYGLSQFLVYHYHQVILAWREGWSTHVRRAHHSEYKEIKRVLPFGTKRIFPWIFRQNTDHTEGTWKSVFNCLMYRFGVSVKEPVNWNILFIRKIRWLLQDLILWGQLQPQSHVWEVSSGVLRASLRPLSCSLPPEHLMPWL
jgi:hypothetical protein